MDRQEETFTMQLVEDKEQFLAGMGLCRTEMVGHMKMNIKKRRDMARSGTRLMHNVMFWLFLSKKLPLEEY